MVVTVALSQYFQKISMKKKTGVKMRIKTKYRKSNSTAFELRSNHNRLTGLARYIFLLYRGCGQIENHTKLQNKKGYQAFVYK